MTASKRWALAIGFLAALLLLYGYLRPRQVARDELALMPQAAAPAARAPAPTSSTGHIDEPVPLKPGPRPAMPTSSGSVQEADRGPEPPKGADPLPAPASGAAASVHATPVQSSPVQSSSKQPVASEATADVRAAKPEPVLPATPHFDVVRVEPTGEAVIAGKAAPDAKVAVMSGGKVIADTKADPDGHFVVLPPNLAPGDYALTLRQTDPTNRAPTVESKQSIAVSVPKARGAGVVVALAEPGKPTTLLSPPPAATPVSPGVNPAVPLPDRLAIGSVELENGSGFYAAGTAKPGTTVRLYVNGTHLADATAGSDGRWSLTLRRGLSAGRYTVRADAIASGKGAVVARVEVPFDVPAHVAAMAPQTPVTHPSAIAPAAPPGMPAAAESAPVPPSAPTPDEAAGPSAEDRTKMADAADTNAIATGSSESTAAPAEIAAPRVADPKTAASEATRPAEAEGQAVAPHSDVSGVPAPGPTAEASGMQSATPQDVVVDDVATASVVRGDNLWDISRKRLGAGVRYTRIYSANASQIRDPDLIYPGQILVVPKR